MRRALLMLGMGWVACSNPPPGMVDAGGQDADAGAPDAGELDAGGPDAGELDAGQPDAGMPGVVLPSDARWEKLSTVPFNGKQDDIHFVDDQHGWYVNGQGYVYKTVNGGQTWAEASRKTGVYWRALGFLDENVGFVGNLGTGTPIAASATDAVPLYRTDNGGQTFTAVTSTGPAAAGICGIDVLRVGEVGDPGHKVIIHAAGRVYGPAFIMRSVDSGNTWATIDLSSRIAMITDVKFVSEQVGFVAGGTSANVAVSKAIILKTDDGAQTWRPVYQSTRTPELIWKLNMPTADVGFATVQSYDTARAQQVIAKTTNGGEQWVEKPLVSDASARQFGIGFVSPTIGWVGTAVGGYQTTDGAETWQPVNMGRAVNKVRMLRTANGFVGYAIGIEVYKLNAER